MGGIITTVTSWAPTIRRFTGTVIPAAIKGGIAGCFAGVMYLAAVFGPVARNVPPDQRRQACAARNKHIMWFIVVGSGLAVVCQFVMDNQGRKELNDIFQLCPQAAVMLSSMI